MSIEMTPEEREDLARHIDCPVSWCGGRWLHHGGDDAPPELWFHEEEEGIDLGHDAWLSRSQVGADPVVWTFVMNHQQIVDTTDPLELAQMLGELAFRVADAAGPTKV